MATRGFVTYTMDDGTNTSLRANSNTAAQNGQTLSKFPPVGVPWAYNYKDLRHFRGVDSSGFKRARMTVCDQSTYDGATIGSTTFTDTAGTSYTLTSKIGEKLDARDIGG